MSARRARRTAEEREFLRPHVSEWFGHRVYPTVADHERSRRDQKSQRCPSLSEVSGRDTVCVKSENSRGVCAISAGSNGARQDWLVCPHRALDDDLLDSMVRRLFGLSADEAVRVVPVTNLTDAIAKEQFVADVHNTDAPRQFLTFQQLFGGEISLPRSGDSPELSFDATVVEVVPAEESNDVRLGRYGVIEMQTTDTHGTYRHAVDALRHALDLHADDFAEQVRAHPDWPGRGVEGPNISNVFKRTFYQVMFKFQITRRASSSGCILALPRPVWDSWQPFLGAPELIDMHDGTYRLRAQHDDEGEPVVAAPNWIYVFDIADEPPTDGSTTPVELQLVVATDAPTLSRLALDVAPRNAIGDAEAEDSIMIALRRRVGAFMPGVL